MAGGGGRGGGETLSGEEELGESGIGDQGVMVREAEREMQPGITDNDNKQDKVHIRGSDGLTERERERVRAIESCEESLKI